MGGKLLNSSVTATGRYHCLHSVSTLIVQADGPRARHSSHPATSASPWTLAHTSARQPQDGTHQDTLSLCLLQLQLCCQGTKHPKIPSPTPSPGLLQPCHRCWLQPKPPGTQSALGTFLHKATPLRQREVAVLPNS